MSEQKKQVCFTLEAALEQAVAMEHAIFKEFLSSMRTIESRVAKDILRDAALNKLKSKHQVERALFEGTIDDMELHEPVPVMRLDSHYGKESLPADADARAALAHAVHLVTRAVDFYQNMAQACSGAPMSPVFERISGDQTKLLQTLEDTYEEQFLTEN